MSTTFKQFKTKALKDSVVKAEYEALGPEYEVVKTIIKERVKRGWSQTELAEAIGSKQPVISRLERGDSNPSLQTLSRIAKALDLSLKVSMRWSPQIHFIQKISFSIGLTYGEIVSRTSSYHHGLIHISSKHLFFKSLESNFWHNSISDLKRL